MKDTIYSMSIILILYHIHHIIYYIIYPFNTYPYGFSISFNTTSECYSG